MILKNFTGAYLNPHFGSFGLKDSKSVRQMKRIVWMLAYIGITAWLIGDMQTADLPLLGFPIPFFDFFIKRKKRTEVL